jgi:hypothetical protein
LERERNVQLLKADAERYIGDPNFCRAQGMTEEAVGNIGIRLLVGAALMSAAARLGEDTP